MEKKNNDIRTDEFTEEQKQDQEMDDFEKYIIDYESSEDQEAIEVDW